ncbi:hypothetical protein D9757_003297 [Collybiopsis confluens]|uniref:Uncharacterized protein n=1 Tax=Collybiopsis confluens TaxID=2823264 RepID=A0A8H5HZ20_9AGAR|nr:hypothetical protein D9757_003297 [Collybiopsis confluens]
MQKINGQVPVPSLPNELLLEIVGCLAYVQQTPKGLRNPVSTFQTPSPDLLSLSFVSWQFRTVSLTFLFANIHITTASDAQKLLEFCSTSSLCPTLTRMLVIRLSKADEENGYATLCQILPSLEQLSRIDLGDFHCNPVVFNTILGHPSLSTVLISSNSMADLPRPLPKDLSKVVLAQGMLCSADHPYGLLLDECAERGMKIAKMSIATSELLDGLSSMRTIRGLQELVLYIHDKPASFSWLPEFTATHPHLKKVWLHVLDDISFFLDPLPFFLVSFAKGLRQRGINRGFRIGNIGLEHERFMGESFAECRWHVREMEIYSADYPSLMKILPLVTLAFPGIDTLSLFLDHNHICQLPTPRVHDLVAVLKHLPRLQNLQLYGMPEAFTVGHGPVSMDDLGEMDQLVSITTASGKPVPFSPWFVFIMKKIQTLKAIKIHQRGFGSTGWLHAIDDSRTKLTQLTY